MDEPFTERRRSPRVTADGGGEVIRPLAMNVRLLDISQGGLLLACSDLTHLAQGARVFTRLLGHPIEAELEIRHVSDRWDVRAGGYRVGARFVLLAPSARRIVQDFLNRGTA